MVASVERMASTSGLGITAMARRGRPLGRPVPAGAEDTWLPALALVVPAVLWLVARGTGLPALRAVPDRATTRRSRSTPAWRPRAASASAPSRASTSTSPGRASSTRSAPIYVLLGGTTPGDGGGRARRGTWCSSLALLRGASRLAPGTGPLRRRRSSWPCSSSRAGLGCARVSSWNPHVGHAAFGVALLAERPARDRRGPRAPPARARREPGPPVPGRLGAGASLLPAGAGLSLMRFARGAPGPRRPDAGPRPHAPAASGPLRSSPASLWALPVLDELDRRVSELPPDAGHAPGATRADALARDTAAQRRRPSTCVATAWRRRAPSPGARATWATIRGCRPRQHDAAASPGYDLRHAPGRARLARRSWRAAGLPPGGRRRTAALAWVAAAGTAAVPLVVTLRPGTHVSLLPLHVGRDGHARRAARGRHGAARADPRPAARSGRSRWPRSWRCPRSWSRDALRSQPAVSTPRDPRSVAIESLTRQIRAQAAADVPGRRFLLRVGPGEDPRAVLGLILALDKAGLRFGGRAVRLLPARGPLHSARGRGGPAARRRPTRLRGARGSKPERPERRVAGPVAQGSPPRSRAPSAPRRAAVAGGISP